MKEQLVTASCLCPSSPSIFLYSMWGADKQNAEMVNCISNFAANLRWMTLTFGAVQCLSCCLSVELFRSLRVWNSLILWDQNNLNKFQNRCKYTTHTHSVSKHLFFVLGCWMWRLLLCCVCALGSVEGKAHFFLLQDYQIIRLVPRVSLFFFHLKLRSEALCV